MDYPEPQSIPERVGGRLVVVIALELTLLLGGTYGAWRVARGQGLGVKAKPSRGMPDEDARPVPFNLFPDPEPAVEAKDRLAVHFGTRAKFALQLTRGEDEQQAVVGHLSSGSRTTIRIDGESRELGVGPGRWLDQPRRLQGVPGQRWIAVWEYPNKIRVTQDVMLIRNNDTPTLDAVLVRYLVENLGEEPRTVGLRFLLDTALGNTDGKPFAVPGMRNFLFEPREFQAGEIPCFLQALERPDLPNIGAVATLTLKIHETFLLGEQEIAVEAADRVVVTGMPQDADWGFVLSDFRGTDSCVAMYWEERRLRPGMARAVGFVYGQGKLFPATGREADLALSYAPRPMVGTEFDILAWIRDAADGQRASIELPDSMRLVKPKTQSVPVVKRPGELSLASWRVKVDPKAVAGNHDVTVRSGGAKATMPIVVRQPDFEVIE